MNIILILIPLITLIIKTNTISFPYCFEYGCEECKDNKYGSCTKCKENFKLIDGKCPCSDSNCLICDSSLLKATCHYCNKDSNLVDDECMCKMKTCENCRNNKCLKCLVPYTYSKYNNMCLLDFSFMNCIDENCKFCLNNEEGSCINCEVGYELINGKCYPLEKCNEKNGKCDSCSDSNYYINNDGYCSYKCLRNTCNNRLSNGYLKCENQCLFCYNYKIYALTNCDNSDYCNIDNCLYCISNNECIQCNPGYYKQNGKCIKCPKNCFDCFSSTKCNTCNYEYKLNNNNECEKIIVSDSEYINEVINFEIDYTEKKIKKLRGEGYDITINDFFSSKNNNITHCLYEVNNYCYLCETEFILKNGICYSKKCEIENCEYCIDNNCISCKTGYEKVYNDSKNTNICNLINECEVPNCKKCRNKICIDCEDGYELTYSKNQQSYICEIKGKNKCNIENCIECENYECKKCKSGYQLYWNDCYLECNIDNCVLCNEDFTCEECKNGYYGSYCEYNDSYYNNDLYDNHYGVIFNKAYKENCPSNCEVCFEYTDICLECKKDCTLNEDNLCECKNKSKKIVLAVVLVIVFLILIISGIIIYKKRDWIRQKFNINNNNYNDNNNNNNNYINNNYDRNNDNNHVSNNNSNNNQNYNTDSQINKSISNVNPDDIQLNNESFISRKLKFDLCDKCGKKEAKYESNCGCKFCPIDSFPGNKMRTKCPKCKKEITKLTPIEFECGICLEKNIKLKHFICGCAFLVCEKCYDITLNNRNINKCPGCRVQIKY